MKKELLFILTLLLFGCSENNFERGEEAFGNENYSTARNYYKNVTKEDGNFKIAQKRLVEIKNIENQLRVEQIKKDSIQKEELNLKNEIKLITELKACIDFVKVFDISIYRGSVGAIQAELDDFKRLSKLILNNQNSRNEEIKVLSKQLKAELIKRLKTEFPILRKHYADIFSEKLWAENIELTIKGKKFTTLEFVGAIFANNKNKKEFQETLSKMLYDLRFKRVNYLWFKYDNEYTYYELNSKEDDSILF
jgi:hypothetical protein